MRKFVAMALVLAVFTTARAYAGENPSMRSVITREDISVYGFRTVAEALESMAGIYTGGGMVSVRGFGLPGDANGRIIVLVNGHRMNENVTDGVLLDETFPVPMDDIALIEVERGPHATYFGGGSVSAVINIVTSMTERTRISGDIGSESTYRLGLSYGKKYVPQGGIYFSTEGFSSKAGGGSYGEFSGINGGDPSADGSKAARFLVMEERNDYVLTVGYAETETGIETAPLGAIFNTDRNRRKDKRSFVELSYDKALDDGRRFQTRFYYDQNTSRLELLRGVDANGIPVRDRGDAVAEGVSEYETEGKWYGTEVRFGEPWLQNHFLTSGYVYEKSTDSDFRQKDGLTLSESSMDESFSWWSLYVRDEYTLGGLRLVAGYRYDKLPVDNVKTPELNLFYRLSEKTVFKVLYGKSFRAPNVYETYFTDGVTHKGNEDLGPEKIKTYQAVVETAVGENLTGSLALYKNEITDLIALDTDPSDGMTYYANISNADTKGIETELSWAVANKYGVALSYALQSAEDGDTGDDLPGYAKQSGSLRAKAVMGKLVAGLVLNYTGSRKTLSGDRTDGGFVADITVSSAYFRDFYVSVGVYDLLDSGAGYPLGATHSPVEGTDGAGRSFRVKLSYVY